jgi:hypothetical protein
MGYSEQQQGLLKKALAVAQKVPEADDGTWTNTWHWVLSYVTGSFFGLKLTTVAGTLHAATFFSRLRMVVSQPRRRAAVRRFHPLRTVTYIVRSQLLPPRRLAARAAIWSHRCRSSSAASSPASQYCRAPLKGACANPISPARQPRARPDPGTCSATAAPAAAPAGNE